MNGGSDLSDCASGGTSTPVTNHLRERHQNDAGQVKQQDFTSECLQAHNYYRKLHGVPDLKLDKKVTRKMNFTGFENYLFKNLPLCPGLKSIV